MNRQSQAVADECWMELSGVLESYLPPHGSEMSMDCARGVLSALQCATAEALVRSLGLHRVTPMQVARAIEAFMGGMSDRVADVRRGMGARP